MTFRIAVAALIAGAAFLAQADKPITITLLNSNDMHGHIEPVKIKGKSYGGYARQATIIKRVRATEPNVLLLSAGDTFQGTFFFNTYEGLADLAYMNLVGYNGATIGNHEFDHGPQALANFVSNALFPIVDANLDFSKEPALNGKVSPSAVIVIGGEKIGLVGATTPTVLNISNPGPNIKLKNLHDSVQAAVDGLTAKGVNKIFLITHIGYREDQDLIKTLHDVDVVVGGHSHTPLGTPDLPGWPKSQGPFPTIGIDSKGVKVPIVQCWEWTKVFGHMTLNFDGNGHLISWSNAKAIVVDESISEDPQVNEMIAAFRKPIAAKMDEQVGSTTTALPEELAGSDGAIGDIVADSMLAATAKNGAVAAFVNEGGVRSPLEQGKITYGNLVSVQPFGNTLVVLTLTGAELKAAFEEGIGGGTLIPSEGTSYSVSRDAPQGSRASDIVVAGKPLDLSASYKCTFLNFTSDGGDAHVMLRDAKGERVNTGVIDLDGLLDYVKVHSPLHAFDHSRITRK